MPVVELADGLDAVRALLCAPQHLVRAVATGRRRGAPAADVAAGEAERVELRPVDLKSGRVLQATHRSGPAVRTHNHPVGSAAGGAGPSDSLTEAVDALLAVPFAHWHVETLGASGGGADHAVTQLRVTKRGQAQLSRSRSAPVGGGAAEPLAVPTEGVARAHDRAKDHLLDPDDPVFAVLGADGPKRRQVEAFLRQLAVAVADLAPVGADGGPRPLRVVDLGCGNAYLTFAAHRWLSGRPTGARTVGVELRADLVARATERAAQAALEGLTFLAGTIADADPLPALGGAPDVVLALHACDTATDDALARAVRWGAPVVLAAPCCHRDVQRQLAAGLARSSGGGEGGAAPVVAGPQLGLLRSPILRERFADVLTDALRADVLRALGHRVEVVEFVDSAHTPRNALLRVVRSPSTAAARRAADQALEELEGLSEAWGVAPVLAQRLAPELAAGR